MSRRYVLSPRAQDDRDGIFDYTALRSGDVEVAFRVDQKLEKTLDDIAANPTIGHTRIDLGIPENLLVRAVYSYLVMKGPPLAASCCSSAAGFTARKRRDRVS